MGLTEIARDPKCLRKRYGWIQSVQRAIDIINCFDEHELKLTLPQISAKLELNINTVRGLVNTLVANGYLEHVADGNCYMLGLAFLPKADLAGANDIDRLRSRVASEPGADRRPLSGISPDADHQQRQYFCGGGGQPHRFPLYFP